jgi:TonB family protein
MPQPDKLGVYEPYGVVKNARLINAVPAALPPGATVATGGHVSTLSMVIGVDGIPSDVQVVNNKKSPLDNAAIMAVKQSTFAPGTLHGKPVPVRTFVWMPFLDADHPAIPVTGQIMHLENMTQPRPINFVEADFSEEARRKHFSGTTLLAVTVTEDGLPIEVHVVEPLGMGLDEQALKATRQYRFKPATLDGIPVPVPLMVEINFLLRPNY